MRIPCVIIGGGLSGLAAAIRIARFSPEVLILEKHSRIGGLNSYYFRDKRLIETGLHAITNYAVPSQKNAPLNRLFRQLKLSRKSFVTYPQYASEVCFKGRSDLLFSNNFDLLNSEVANKFPNSTKGFERLVEALDRLDPFLPTPFQSAKAFLFDHLEDELLTDMLLCPLMYYGSSVEGDMDLSQFAIMFRSIYQEGMFRPEGTMKSFLDTLHQHYVGLGGKVRLNGKVERILHENNKVQGVELANGEQIECDHLLSTIGHEETLHLLDNHQQPPKSHRLGFVESVYLLKKEETEELPRDKTIIFFNRTESFRYQRPEDVVDYNSGVICFPSNFQGRPEQDLVEVRSTHLANYDKWAAYARNDSDYAQQKKLTGDTSQQVLEELLGSFRDRIVFQDTFTPVTIEKFTAKTDGAIYGSPMKIKDGDLGFLNLHLAGTDQGFLGIVGSMLSGVSMVNRHILPQIETL